VLSQKRNEGLKMINIPGCEAFAKIEPINKGWTNEKKYYIETSDGRRLLLRIADASEYKHKKAQYAMLERISELDIPISHPVDFGLCDDDKNVYQLITWVDGEDVESVLPTMSKTEQYHFGLKAGRLLQKIHSIPAPEGTEDWDIYFNRMLRRELEAYHSRMELHSDFGEMIIEYFNENRDILGVRPQTFIHGDYNPGNLIIMPSGELGVIDFSSSYGDPCWDIFKVAWRPTLFPHFYSGQIWGHFNSEPTLEFWNAYTHYFAFGALIALTGPQWVGLNDLEEGKSVVQNILTWSDNFKNPIPAWYLHN
jgi:aminoglycoside phosphotransferase (APT) family kinase protein